MELGYFQLALDFIEKSKTASNLDELGKAFHMATQGLGFNHYACVSCVEFGQLPEGAVFLADYPGDWTNHYLAQQYDRQDRILQISLKQSMPFSWDAPFVTQRITPEQNEIFDEAQDAGLLYGITVPIHVVGALPGSVNVVGENRDLPPEAEHAVHLMSVYLHDAALKLASQNKDKPEPVVKLTKREIECLEWVSAGKTDWEISSILSISERTVHNHVESAKVKLGVHTRVQAVVKAFLSNLIHYR